MKDLTSHLQSCEHRLLACDFDGCPQERGWGLLGCNGGLSKGAASVCFVRYREKPGQPPFRTK